jgi:hypothetical protein
VEEESGMMVEPRFIRLTHRSNTEILLPIHRIVEVSVEGEYTEVTIVSVNHTATYDVTQSVEKIHQLIREEGARR